ncbi:MAG: hypothetical protein R3F30_00525 [Planctomycetota bacterium]
MHPRALAPALVLATVLAPLPAQHYDAAVLIKGLDKPTGIAVDGRGHLALTELPLPGQSSPRNKVSQWSPVTDKVDVLVTGEPAPTHIAVRPDGGLVWTCSTAGVIMSLVRGKQVPVARGLNQPSGIAVDAGGTLYFTQVPTPGVPGGKGGKNEVLRLDPTGPVSISKGEPEPVDVAVDRDGNLYWTCKSAGVILRRDAKTGVIAKLLDELDKPSGIAVDDYGDVWFTEVPTPGKGGSAGGRNKVWRYSQHRAALTLIHFGDPEPTDIAVTADGSRAYWTCTSAGVVVEAVRRDVDATALASAVGPFALGRFGEVRVSAPGQGGKPYAALASLGLGPIAFGKDYVALTPDGVFLWTLSGGGAPVFTGTLGTLDQSGVGKSMVNVPNLAGLKGLHLYMAYVVLDNTAPMGVARISDTARILVP